MAGKAASIETLVNANQQVPVSVDAGNIGVTDKIMGSNGTAYTPKFILANVAASQTDSNIVTAVTAKKIRVLGVIVLTAATATNVTFNSKGAGAGTAISALFACGANNGFALGFNPVGWFETAAGEALTVTTGAGSTTGFQIVYIEV